MLALPQLIVFSFILNDSILYSFCSFSPEITYCPVFPANFFSGIDCMFANCNVSGTRWI